MSTNSPERPDITAVYVWLFLFLESINYFEEHPTRFYIREWMQSDMSTEEKVRRILQDGIVQRHLYKNWITTRYEIDNDPIKYFYDHIKIN